jgi:NAD(P)-dependent dehydrogenase (short-subunit alcohol dehydrogenase family)
LARDGAEVIVHGRRAERGREIVAAIESDGGKARFIEADLSNPEAIRRLADEIGEIDILINNAGFSVWGATAEVAVSDFDGMFAANVRAPYYLVAAFAPAMAARGSGSVINIGSMAGTVGLPGGAAYGATKAALAALTRSWPRSSVPPACPSTRWLRGRSTHAPRAGTCLTSSDRRRPQSGRRSPRRWPSSSPLWPPLRPAT